MSTNNGTNPVKEHALAYVDLKLGVVQVYPGTKKPIGDDWPNRALRTRDAVNADVNGTINIGIMCGKESGVWVLDVDVQHDGDATLADLVAEHGPLPHTWMDRTPQGGNHWYFRWPDDPELAARLVSTEKLFGMGLDCKADGGQVLVAPSVWNGRPYAWTPGHDPRDGVALADAPMWLYELLIPTVQEPRRDVPPYTGPDRPGDRWAASHSWADILTGDKANYLRTITTDRKTGCAYELWSRPEHEVDEPSATLYYGGTQLLVVHSDAWPAFNGTKLIKATKNKPHSYSKFAYYTAMHHGEGNFPEAARALAREEEAAYQEAEDAGSGTFNDDVLFGDRDDPGTGGAAEANHARDPWPVMEGVAYRGLAGEVIAALNPHTEADPNAMLLSLLTMYGNAVGPGPYVLVGADRHAARLFVVVVGETSRARKGSGFSMVRVVMVVADIEWSKRMMSGFGSGERMVDEVSDGADEVLAKDRRLLVRESEYARILKVVERENSTLSPLLREAWDGGVLSVRTRAQVAVATGAHISVVGDITAEELRRGLSSTEVANGFGNRFLHVLARRSKRLPSGGNLTDDDIDRLAKKIRENLRLARQHAQVTRTPEAEQLWEVVYATVDDTVDGLLGAMTARAEAYMVRLSLSTRCWTLFPLVPLIQISPTATPSSMWPTSGLPWRCGRTANRACSRSSGVIERATPWSTNSWKRSAKPAKPA